jgi:hypothetical protein
MRLHSPQRLVVLALALTLGTAGCASGGSGSTRPPGATTNRIVQAELEALPQMNALQAIERLRNQWLRTRSGDAPQLYVDGARRSSISDLQSILSTEVEQMQYMSAGDATNRFGTGHTGGAILVTMK